MTTVTRSVKVKWKLFFKRAKKLFVLRSSTLGLQCRIQVPSQPNSTFYKSFCILDSFLLNLTTFYSRWTAGQSWGKEWLPIYHQIWLLMLRFENDRKPWDSCSIKKSFWEHFMRMKYEILCRISWPRKKSAERLLFGQMHEKCNNKTKRSPWPCNKSLFRL